jgi:succinate dehydrogenase / fumarate reductase, membrane anchor subunit
MSYRTDRQRAIGLGSAKEGSGHWWSQRVNSLALLLLTPFFVFPLATHLGGSYEEVRAAYAQPFNAIVAILFVGVGFWHLQQGLQVVMEDYVSNKPLLTGLLLANILLCTLFGLVGVFAVAKIAFGV